ncbi:MAG: hypothetical protein AB1560_08600 [Pseudomonadota bacterium]
MPTVELIYDRDCPNVPQARANLLRAFNLAGLAPRWHEWDRAEADVPAYVKGYGSPTILVNRTDVAGATATDAACCRIYTNDKGAKQGVPPVSLIVSALRTKSNSGKPGRNTLSLLPAVGTALMPKLVCPVCWPAYTGLLGAMGLGFVNYTPFLLPLSAVFLATVLATLAWRAKARRGYAPLILGTVAAATVLIGKFQFDSDTATYAGIALLIGASAWNAWPRRGRAASCPACSDSACTDYLKGGVT